MAGFPSTNPAAPAQGSKPASEIDGRLAALWQRNLPEFRARLLLLRQAAESAASGDLSGEQLQQAVHLAHGFAGSLGMYGYPAAGLIARELESELRLAGSESQLILLVAQLSAAIQG